jgi:dihydroorotate dehydrogenase
MPDWSYQTLLRPLLFRLPAARARALTMAALGALSAWRSGPQIIALMGHTRPATDLARDALGLRFPAPLGIGADLPGNEVALGALSRFGVGYVEVGPAALADSTAPLVIERQPQAGSIGLRGDPAVAVERLAAQLARATVPARVIVRLAFRSGASAAEAAAERVALIDRLAPYADAFSLAPPAGAWNEAAWRDHLAEVVAATAARGRPLLVGIAPGAEHAEVSWVVAPAAALGVAGTLICGGARGPGGERRLGAPAQRATLATVRHLRQGWGHRLAIFAAGGAIEPRDALALFEAGADFVQLDAGLVYGGPGLPKRINEALGARGQRTPRQRPSTAIGSWLSAGWLWMLLLGLGMVVSGVLAGFVAATRVVLPYDEAFVGIARSQIDAINPRLLAFMAHDRVALAGAMISIGAIYIQLAWHALRRHAHWARQTIAISAGAGFLSFFLFLGYGYFDPLHALAALLLLPLFLLGLRGPTDAPPDVPAADLQNDRAWQLAQWGQLGVIGLGTGLIGAGAAIALVGATAVFVPADLAFLCTTPAALHAANARLIALIAHDRAGSGGRCWPPERRASSPRSASTPPSATWTPGTCYRE